AEDLQGPRRRDHLAPSAPRVLHHTPLLRLDQERRAIGGVEGAHRLRRMSVRRILLIDDDLREERHDLAVEPGARQLVPERALEKIPDPPLRLGDADVDRRGRHLRDRLLYLDEEMADLGTVPVDEDEIPSPPDDADEEARERL